MLLTAEAYDGKTGYVDGEVLNVFNLGNRKYLVRDMINPDYVVHNNSPAFPKIIIIRAYRVIPSSEESSEAGIEEVKNKKTLEALARVVMEEEFRTTGDNPEDMGTE